MSDELKRVHHNISRKRLEIDLGDGQKAFAAYDLDPGSIRFHHTVVPENHGGKGLGTALIRAAIALAREQGLAIIPICPFFRAYFRKHPEEAEIVATGYRHLLKE